MPLHGENRVFVSRGLESLRNTKRPGIAALMAECGCAPETVSASSIGFMLAPRINAAGRIGQIELAVELFLTEDPERAQTVARQLCDLNRQRQAVESEIYSQAISMLPQGKTPDAIVLADESWHQGVVGIVASRIAEEYSCPTFLICLDGEHGKASSRSHGGFNLFSSLTTLSDLLESYGGHELAAGFTITRSNIPEFRRQVCRLAADFYCDDSPRTVLDIDCAIACHVNGTRDVGKVYFHSGPSNSNSMGILCEFFGTTAHAHSQQKGVDAIRMAVQAWHSLEIMAAREIPSKESFVFNVGQIQGGNTNNIVCDYCKLFISARAWTDELSAYMENRVREICQGIAQMCGGEAKVTVTKLIPYMDNSPILVEKLRESAEKTLGKDSVGIYERGMGAEDFSFISRKKPAVMMSMGTGCDSNSDTRRPVHNNHFDVDERCFDTGIDVFVNFILDNQDGIEF
jgi:hypothetical protein